MNILSEIWFLLCEMSPFLLLGFMLAGLMHEFVPNTLYTRYLGKPTFGSVVLAAFFGVPLPLCSCGVIPTAMGIRREGASKGATISFLIATPQTGVDSIIATYSLMGLPFAVIRPVVALLTAIFGGTLCNVVENVDDNLNANLSDDKKPTSSSTSSPKRLRRAFAYAFGEMMEDIGKWLAVGLVVAGIITAAVPNSWFNIFQDNTLYSILFVLVFSIPMYLCATGSIPIAMALMLKGLTPGAALVLLMAGPACNAASILVVGKVLGKRTMLIYLVSIVVGAIVFGFGIDHLLPREWFNAPISHYAACHEEGVGLFSYLCTAFLLACLVRAFWPWKQHHHHHHHAESACTIYRVEGMNCSHCAANVRKAIAAVEGVEQVDVSLHEGTASVAGSAKEDKIMQAIESIGFKASKSPD